MISFSKEYDAHIIVLFHATGDFNYRSRWKVGVKKVEEVDHFLPRIGMRCRCILNNGHSNIYSSSYSFGPERIEFSETDEDNGNTLVYILEKIAEYKTRLTLDFYITKNIGRQAWFNLAKKKKVEEGFQKSLENLVLLSQEIKLPGI